MRRPGHGRRVGLIAGPPKTVPEGPPAPRLTTHKLRSTWFQARAAWPVREAATHQLVGERTRIQESLLPTPGAGQWASVGPSNIGGRMTSIVGHPANADHIWAGSAGGGVWESTDAGRTWKPLWGDQDIRNVGSLVLDPGNPAILYCGTGEANLSADSYPGVGLYQSTDGGQSWRLLAASATTGIPRRIGSIAVDPFDSRHLRTGGVGHQLVDRPDQSDVGGLCVSRDGGITWNRETFVTVGNYWCHAVLFHPTRRGVIYATCTEQGANSGIWRSSDGGMTWEHLLLGLPDPARFGRTSLAISPSNPDVLYAIAEDELSGRQDLVLGVFRSEDGGSNWSAIGGTEFRQERQMSYGNTIAVHPTDSNTVVCGGVDLHLTTDGGATWSQVTHWDAQRGTPRYAHADHHALLMPAAAPGRIYDCNDGGMDVSEDAGQNWNNRSSGLAATMFYDIDVAQSDSRVFGGGAQDNGTVITTSGKDNDFMPLLGGDGGWMVFDPQNPGHLYASYYNMHIYRWQPGTNPQDVSPPADDRERQSVWMVFIVMSPNDSSTVFTGSYRVWRTQDDGNTWTAISDNLDGSPISAIEVARADPMRVYVGTENGGIFRSLDGGATWSPNLAGATVPGYVITRLETRPDNAEHVFAAVANFGQSHVFRSTDGGTSWSDIDKSQLPDVPHHVVVIPPDSPDTVYVGNDAGVFASTDAGETWTNLSQNLPHVMVIDLVYQGQEKTLTAATYGRSLWRLKVG